jgi:hypothetical protein
MLGSPGLRFSCRRRPGLWCCLSYRFTRFLIFPGLIPVRRFVVIEIQFFDIVLDKTTF